MVRPQGEKVVEQRLQSRFPVFESLALGSVQGAGCLACSCYSDLLLPFRFSLEKSQKIRVVCKISDSKGETRNIFLNTIIYFDVYRKSFMGWNDLFEKMLIFFLFIREIIENK